jgi:hypothetical protein
LAGRDFKPLTVDVGDIYVEGEEDEGSPSLRLGQSGIDSDMNTPFTKGSQLRESTVVYDDRDIDDADVMFMKKERDEETQMKSQRFDSPARHTDPRTPSQKSALKKSSMGSPGRKPSSSPRKSVAIDPQPSTTLYDKSPIQESPLNPQPMEELPVEESIIPTATLEESQIVEPIAEAAHSENENTQSQETEHDLEEAELEESEEAELEESEEAELEFNEEDLEDVSDWPEWGALTSKKIRWTGFEHLDTEEMWALEWENMQITFDRLITGSDEDDFGPFALTGQISETGLFRITKTYTDTFSILYSGQMDAETFAGTLLVSNTSPSQDPPDNTPGTFQITPDRTLWEGTHFDESQDDPIQCWLHIDEYGIFGIGEDEEEGNYIIRGDYDRTTRDVRFAKQWLKGGCMQFTGVGDELGE